MNIIEIVAKQTSTSLTISDFTSHFGNCNFSLRSPNRLVPVHFFLDKLKKVNWITTPLHNSPEQSVK